MSLTLGHDTGSLDTGQFHESEKRSAAFKFVFGILQTSAYSEPSGEQFDVTPAVYSDEIISGFVKKTQNNNSVNPNYKLYLCRGSGAERVFIE